MPKRILTGALLVTILSGCQPPTSPGPEDNEKENGFDAAASAEARSLASKSWCSVRNPAEQSRNVLTVTFLSEGYALFRQLEQDPDTRRFTESGGLFSWALKSDLLSYQDFESGESFDSRFRWLRHSPVIDKDSLWKNAVSADEQDCFHVSPANDEGTGEEDIFCPCDPDKIWESSTAQ